MAVKEVVTKQCSCDLCKKTVATEKELTNLYLPVKFLTNQTDGAACKPYYINPKFNLCGTCLDKVTVVLGQGAQGYNDFWLKRS